MLVPLRADEESGYHPSSSGLPRGDWSAPSSGGARSVQPVVPHRVWAPGICALGALLVVAGAPMAPRAPR